MVFFIVLIISTIQWFVDGRKNFKGPKIDMDALAAGEVAGMTLEGEGVDHARTHDAENGVVNGDGMEKTKSSTIRA